MAFIQPRDYSVTIPIRIADQTATGARSTRSSVDSMLKEQLRAIESANRSQVADARRTALELQQADAQAALREIASYNARNAAKKAADDKFTRESLANIRQMESERARIVAENDRAIEQSAKQAADFQIREGKRVANEIIAESRARQQAAAGSGGGFGGVLTSAFSGGGAGGMVGGLLGGFGGAIFGGTVFAGIEKTIDQLRDLADVGGKFGEEMIKAQAKTKLQVDTLLALRIGAKGTDTDFEGLTKGLGRYLKNIGLAADGNKIMQRNLELVGISADELPDLINKPDVAIRRLWEGFAKLGPTARENQAAIGLLGRAGVDSILLMREAGGNLDDLIDKQKKFYGNLDIEQLKIYEHSIKDMDSAWEGLKITLSSRLAPTLQELYLEFTKLVSVGGSWTDKLQSASNLLGLLGPQIVPDYLMGTGFFEPKPPDLTGRKTYGPTTSALPTTSMLPGLLPGSVDWLNRGAPTGPPTKTTSVAPYLPGKEPESVYQSAAAQMTAQENLNQKTLDLEMDAAKRREQITGDMETSVNRQIAALNKWEKANKTATEAQIAHLDDEFAAEEDSATKRQKVADKKLAIETKLADDETRVKKQTLDLHTQLEIKSRDNAVKAIQQETTDRLAELKKASAKIDAQMAETGAAHLKSSGENFSRLFDVTPDVISKAEAKLIETYKKVLANPGIQKAVEAASATYHVASDLINAVIAKESSGVAGAISPEGAKGLMQLMDTTAAHYGLFGKDIFDVNKNINIGTKELAAQLKLSGGDVMKALVGYNSSFKNFSGDLSKLPAETQDYVKKIGGILKTSGVQTQGEVMSRIQGEQEKTKITVEGFNARIEGAKKEQAIWKDNAEKYQAYGSQIKALENERDAATEEGAAKQRAFQTQIGDSYDQLSAQVNQAIGKLNGAEESALAQSEAFQRQWGKLKIDGLGILSPEAISALDALIPRLKELSIIKLQGDTTKSLESIERSLEGITKTSQHAELDKITQMLISTRGYDLKQDAFKPIEDLVLAAGTNPEAITSLRALLVTMMAGAKGKAIADGDFDKTIDRIIAALKLGAELDTAEGRYRVRVGTEDRNLRNQLEASQTAIAEANESSAVRIQIAKQKAYNAVVLADQSATESIIASQVHLADAMTLHTPQVYAGVLSHLEQVKTVSQAMIESLNGAYDKLTSSVDASLNKTLHGLGLIKDMVVALVNQLLSRVFQQFLSMIFGGGQQGSPQFGQSSQGNQSGGILSRIFGGSSGGGIFGSIFGGGSSGVAGGMTSPASLTAGWGAQGVGNQGLGDLFIASGSTAAGGFSLAGLGASLGPLAPLIGAGLGISLGGQSRFGQILGGIGGGVAGLGIASALGFGLLPFAFPFLPVAGALLIGAILLARNAARRKNETDRNQLSTDTYTAIIQILNDARVGKYGSATEALAAFDKVKSDYFARIAKYDSKTKRIATETWYDTKNGFEYYRPLITEAAKTAENAGNIRARMVPVFASGGYSAKDQLIKVRPGEGVRYPGTSMVQTIPGRDMGYDSQYMYAPAGTRIIPNSQMRSAKPFASGGNVGDAGGSNTPNILQIDSIDVKEFNLDGDGLVTLVIKSQQFKDQVIKNVRLGRLERGGI